MAAIDHKTGAYLRTVPLLASLPEAQFRSLIAASTLVTHDKHTLLNYQGDPASHLTLVIEGWIKLFRQTAEGEEAVVAILSRGDVFGESAIMEDGILPFAAEAAEPCRLSCIPGKELRSLARNHHEVLVEILSIMSGELRSLQMENEHLALMSAPQRVGCLLLQLSSGMLGKGGTFSFPYDKALAAARLTMKPETFSRALAQLKDAGVTVKGPEVTIASFASLVEYCCSSCSASADECQGCRGCASTSCHCKTA